MKRNSLLLIISAVAIFNSVITMANFIHLHDTPIQFIQPASNPFKLADSHCNMETAQLGCF